MKSTSTIHWTTKVLFNKKCLLINVDAKLENRNLGFPSLQHHWKHQQSTATLNSTKNTCVINNSATEIEWVLQPA